MNGRISGAAALILGLGAASNAWAMDSRAPSAEPPASLASPAASPAPEAAAASSFAAPASAAADPTRLRAGAPATFRLAPEATAPGRLSAAASQAPAAAPPAASPEAPADPVLELHFADLEAAAATAPAVRVFLNKPDATPATSTEDPHYVGVVSFFPISPEAEGSRFRLPLRETLGRIGPVTPETAEVTLIPVDLGAGAAPPFELRLLGMGLETPR